MNYIYIYIVIYIYIELIYWHFYIYVYLCIFIFNRNINSKLEYNIHKLFSNVFAPFSNYIIVTCAWLLLT